MRECTVREALQDQIVGDGITFGLTCKRLNKRRRRSRRVLKAVDWFTPLSGSRTLGTLVLRKVTDCWHGLMTQADPDSAKATDFVPSVVSWYDAGFFVPNLYHPETRCLFAAWCGGFNSCNGHCHEIPANSDIDDSLIESAFGHRQL